MRKCGTCGYLLFGDGDTCNHCGNPVPAVVARVGAARAEGSATPAGRAPTTPVSNAAAPEVPRVWQGPSFAAPTPVPPATPAHAEADVWRPVVTKPAPAGHKFPAGIVLAMVGLVVIGALGFTFVKNRNELPGGTSDFVAGNGVSFTAPDRSYTAQFPEEPKVESAAVPVGNATAQLSLASVETDSYEMGTATFNFGVAIPRDRVEGVLDEALKGGVSGVDGDLVSKQQITRGGLPAIDAKLKASDGYSAHVLVLMKGSRIYLLYVHAKTGTDKLFDAFDKSFVPTGM